MSLETIIRRVSKYSMYVAGSMLCVMMLLTTANVIARYAFNSPLFGQSEIVQLLQLVAISIAGGHTLLKHGHVTIGLVVDRLGHRSQAVCDLITHLLTLGFCVVASWKTIERAVILVHSGGSTSILKISLAPMYFIMGIGWASLCLCSGLCILEYARQAAKP
jgi:TRAP-type transport system small permease protein